MASKKKMSNKSFSVLWGAILAVFLVVIIVANVMLEKYATIVTRSLGQTTSKIVTTGESTGDSEYFKSAFASQDELVDYETQVSEQIEQEGSVLLKNENNALPMAEGTKVSLFSISSVNLLYGGGGSGSIYTDTCDTLKDVLEAEGMSVNPTMWEFYSGKTDDYGRRDGNSWTGEQGKIGEVPVSQYTSAVKDSFAEYNDAAIVVISRNGQEGADLSLTMEESGSSFLTLTSEEKDMLQMAADNFDTVIVLLNTANAMELGWMDDYGVDACLWIGYPGQTGLAGVGYVLSGKVNPSGRLVDTYAVDSLSSAAMQNFGCGYITNATNEVSSKHAYVVYGEGIYVGYRYYETRYEDTVLNQGNAASTVGVYASSNGWNYDEEVLYPFGYGLSYTTFDYSNFSMKEEGDNIVVTVDVTNTGDVAGSHVVEVYFQSPYTDYDKENGIEKASIELCGFDRTGELAPSESETVTITVPKEELRTYDANNAKTYILDAGDYYFTVGADAHDALNNVLAAKGKTVADGMTGEGNAALAGAYTVDSLDSTTYAVDAKTGVAITNQFDQGSMTYYDADYTYLSRSDWAATWPTFYGEQQSDGSYALEASEELLHDSQDNLFAEDADAVMPTTGENVGLQLITLKGVDYDDPSWDELLDQLTVDEMMEMARLGGWQTMEIESIGKPKSNDQDGPAGITDTLIGSDTGCMGYPIEIVMASTWDEDLLQVVGECVGEDGLAAGVQGWYAPGAGTHRTPYGGRNFEYYSEDGFLAGTMAAREVAGAQSKGMYVYLKHMVLNDSETERYGINTFCNEQALREIYLTAFEKPVRDADCTGIMAAFNGIGGIWCGANDGLLNQVLRSEWGFKGIVVTDFASYNTGYMWIDMGLTAGSDLWLNTDSDVYKLDNVASSPTLVSALREMSHHVLYTVVNSAAMNGIASDTKVISVRADWENWLIAADAAAAVIVIGGIALIYRRCKKNSAEQAQ
jgi:beta-glucosidase